MTIPFFHWFFKLRKQRKQLIILRDKEGHQLTIKHIEIIQKIFSTITLDLGSQPPLNNHQFNFDNNSISTSPFKVSRTKDEQILIIYKNIRQIQQQLNYTNQSFQHLHQQTTKIFSIFVFFYPGKEDERNIKINFFFKLFLNFIIIIILY